MAEFDEQAPKEKLSQAEAIAKLKEIQVGFRALVYCLHENISALDDDPDFQERFQSMQDDAEQKAKNLESEVRRLRSDVKTFKDFILFFITFGGLIFLFYFLMGRADAQTAGPLSRLRYGDTTGMLNNELRRYSGDSTSPVFLYKRNGNVYLWYGPDQKLDAASSPTFTGIDVDTLFSVDSGTGISVFGVAPAQQGCLDTISVTVPNPVTQTASFLTYAAQLAQKVDSIQHVLSTFGWTRATCP